MPEAEWKWVCQRPERAFFISTATLVFVPRFILSRCQRPERAFFISTDQIELEKLRAEVCQRPERAFFISTLFGWIHNHHHRNCVNALNGLSSFLL